MVGAGGGGIEGKREGEGERNRAEKDKCGKTFLKKLNFNLNGQSICHKTPTAYHWSVPDKLTRSVRHACHVRAFIALFLIECINLLPSEPGHTCCQRSG